MSHDVTVSARTPPRKSVDVRIFAGVMLLVVVLRGFIFCIGLLSVRAAPQGNVAQVPYAFPWQAFDACNYREIALHGYPPARTGETFFGGNRFTLIAFFPLFPLVSRALSAVMSLDAGMILLSNLCALAAFAFMYDWARRVAGTRPAIISVLLAATFPGAVFFASGMTEGPFFLLAALTLWLLEKGNLYGAALVAGISTLTRPTGVALAFIVPLYAWVKQEDMPISRRLTTFVQLSVISLSGVAGYEIFLWHRYKSPTAYLDAQSHWNDLFQNRVHIEAAQGIKRYSYDFFRDHLMRPSAWNRAITLVILVVTVVGLFKARRMPRLLLLFPLVVLLMTSLPDKGVRISSVPRYESAAAPLFLLVAMWFSLPPESDGEEGSAGLDWSSRRERKTRLGLALLLVAQLGLQVYYAMLFPRQIWVG